MIKYIILLLISFNLFAQNQIGLTEARSLYDMNVIREFILVRDEYQTRGMMAIKYINNNTDSVFVSLNRKSDYNNKLDREDCVLFCRNANKEYEQMNYTNENLINWMINNYYKEEEISIIVNYVNEMFIW